MTARCPDKSHQPVQVPNMSKRFVEFRIVYRRLSRKKIRAGAAQDNLESQLCSQFTPFIPRFWDLADLAPCELVISSFLGRKSHLHRRWMLFRPHRCPKSSRLALFSGRIHVCLKMWYTLRYTHKMSIQ